MHFEALLGPTQIGFLLLAAAAVNGLLAFSYWIRKETQVTAHFSPRGGCAAAIVAELTAARSEILVQAYSFTCPEIAQALIAAVNRRVRVIVLPTMF